jgi:hypothetical protein
MHHGRKLLCVYQCHHAYSMGTELDFATVIPYYYYYYYYYYY